MRFFKSIITLLILAIPCFVMAQTDPIITPDTIAFYCPNETDQPINTGEIGFDIQISEDFSPPFTLVINDTNTIEITRHDFTGVVPQTQDNLYEVTIFGGPYAPYETVIEATNCDLCPREECPYWDPSIICVAPPCYQCLYCSPGEDDMELVEVISYSPDTLGIWGIDEFQCSMFMHPNQSFDTTDFEIVYKVRTQYGVEQICNYSYSTPAYEREAEENATLEVNFYEVCPSASNDLEEGTYQLNIAIIDGLPPYSIQGTLETIVQNNGETISLILNEEDAYNITVTDPIGQSQNFVGVSYPCAEQSCEDFDPITISLFDITCINQTGYRVTVNIQGGAPEYYGEGSYTLTGGFEISSMGNTVFEFDPAYGAAQAPLIDINNFPYVPGDDIYITVTDGFCTTSTLIDTPCDGCINGCDCDDYIQTAPNTPVEVPCVLTNDSGINLVVSDIYDLPPNSGEVEWDGESCTFIYYPPADTFGQFIVTYETTEIDGDKRACSVYMDVVTPTGSIFDSQLTIFCPNETDELVPTGEVAYELVIEGGASEISIQGVIDTFLTAPTTLRGTLPQNSLNEYPVRMYADGIDFVELAGIGNDCDLCPNTDACEITELAFSPCLYCQPEDNQMTILEILSQTDTLYGKWTVNETGCGFDYDAYFTDTRVEYVIEYLVETAHGLQDTCVIEISAGSNLGPGINVDLYIDCPEEVNGFMYKGEVFYQLALYGINQEISIEGAIDTSLFLDGYVLLTGTIPQSGNNRYPLQISGDGITDFEMETFGNDCDLCPDTDACPPDDGNCLYCRPEDSQMRLVEVLSFLPPPTPIEQYDWSVDSLNCRIVPNFGVFDVKLDYTVTYVVETAYGLRDTCTVDLSVGSSPFEDPPLIADIKRICPGVDNDLEEGEVEMLVVIESGVPPFAISGTINATLGELNQSTSVVIGELAPYEIQIEDAIGQIFIERTDFVVPCEKLNPEIVYFEGEALPNGNLLEWYSVSEDQNDYYLLQHATDGINFTTITQLDGAGTTSETNHYTFLHKAAPVGLSYYRLLSTSFDGSQENHGVITLLRGEQANSNLHVYPVPASDILYVEWSNNDTRSIQFNLYDITGRQVLTKTQTLGNGTFTIPLEVARLSAGTYILEVVGEEHQYQKIVIE